MRNKEAYKRTVLEQLSNTARPYGGWVEAEYDNHLHYYVEIGFPTAFAALYWYEGIKATKLIPKLKAAFRDAGTRIDGITVLECSVLM